MQMRRHNPQLSHSEYQVLNLVLKGHARVEVAEILGMPETMVIERLENALRKLQQGSAGLGPCSYFIGVGAFIPLIE